MIAREILELTPAEKVGFVIYMQRIYGYVLIVQTPNQNQRWLPKQSLESQSEVYSLFLLLDSSFANNSFQHGLLRKPVNNYYNKSVLNHVLKSHGHGPWTTTSTLTSVLELDLDIRSRTDYLVKFTLLD